MIILKQGTSEAILKPKRFLCNRCGCYFEANKNEYYYGTQIEPGPFCKCPNCGAICDEQ